MATNVNVQGTSVYILDVPATAWTDCDKAVTAILTSGKKASCLQAMGDLSRSRDIVEYSCQDNNNSSKAAGKISYGDFDLGLLLDTTDKTGQEALFNAMEANTPIIIAFEAPNKAGSTGKSGDIIWTEAVIAGDKIGYPENGKVTYDVTISPYGGFTRCAKT